MPNEPPETPVASYLQHAGKTCKLTIKKDWKTTLEGGLWMSIPFDWDALSAQDQQRITHLHEGYTPFALVGPAAYSGTFAEVASASDTFLFGFNEARQVYVLYREAELEPKLTRAQVDDLIFRPLPAKKQPKG